jgi:hypothetical protein
MELTERDILIELKADVKNLSNRFDAFEKKFDSDRKDYDTLQSKVDSMEPKVEELCKFKIWFYVSVIASGFSVIMFLINLFIKE